MRLVVEGLEQREELGTDGQVRSCGGKELEERDGEWEGGQRGMY